MSCHRFYLGAGSSFPKMKYSLLLLERYFLQTQMSGQWPCSFFIYPIITLLFVWNVALAPWPWNNNAFPNADYSYYCTRLRAIGPGLHKFPNQNCKRLSKHVLSPWAGSSFPKMKYSLCEKERLMILVYLIRYSKGGPFWAGLSLEEQSCIHNVVPLSVTTQIF